MQSISIGGDPEFFLEKDGALRSAHNMVPGTKEEPFKLKHGAVQRDGCAVEFNIDPAYSADEYTHNICETLLEIRKIIPKQYKFVFKPAVTFNEIYFDRVVPKAAKELGCNPDFNAYTGLMNPSPGEIVKNYPTLRTGAGHITLGWTENQDKKDPAHFFDCCMVVKVLDELYMQTKPKFDKDTLRTTLYGNPGAFRPTPFGVEYRVPSNAWVKYPKMYPYMFNLAKCVIEGMDEGEFNPPVFKEEYIQ